MDIGLVSCTKSKRDQAAPPKDLYDESALFRKARAYVEQNHDGWYILSAKHGVPAPDSDPIEPNDETLAARQSNGNESGPNASPRNSTTTGSSQTTHGSCSTLDAITTMNSSHYSPTLTPRSRSTHRLMDSATAKRSRGTTTGCDRSGRSTLGCGHSSPSWNR